MEQTGIKRLYYSISEVSNLVDEEQYVLRYWETEFEQLRPQKNRAGNRIYNEKDIDIIRTIQNLLRMKRFTIDGAKEHLKAMQFETKPPDELNENAEVHHDASITHSELHSNGRASDDDDEAREISEALEVSEALSVGETIILHDDAPPLPPLANLSATIPSIVNEQDSPHHQTSTHQTSTALSTETLPNADQMPQEHATFSQTATRQWGEPLGVQPIISLANPPHDHLETTKPEDNTARHTAISLMQEKSVESAPTTPPTIALSHDELLMMRDTLRSVLLLLRPPPEEQRTSGNSSEETSHFHTNP